MSNFNQIETDSKTLLKLYRSWGQYLLIIPAAAAAAVQRRGGPPFLSACTCGSCRRAPRWPSWWLPNCRTVRSSGAPRRLSPSSSWRKTRSRPGPPDEPWRWDRCPDAGTRPTQRPVRTRKTLPECSPAIPRTFLDRANDLSLTFTQRSGSAQRRSIPMEGFGGSWGRGSWRSWSTDWRWGERPPCMQRIRPPMRPQSGIQLNVSWNLL